MRYRCVAATCVIFVSMGARAWLSGVDQALPLKDGRQVVATVNGESIPLGELFMELEPSADRTHLLQGYGSPKDFELLDRLIVVRLVVQEAATMGLGEAPEIQKQLDVAARAILREVLLEGLVKDVTPDAAAVEEQYKELAREWKTASLLFADEALAKAARAELANGKDYAEVAAKAVAAKAAKIEGNDEYHPRKDYLPEVAAALATLGVGQVSPVVAIQAGFVVVKVVDIRYPDNPEARAEAVKRVLGEQQQTVLKAHDEASRREYVVVHKAVLDGLDYEAAQPGVDALLKDTRVVAEVKGGAPVTVGDLTDYLRMQFFHGSDQAGQRKRMNEKKEAALDATLGRRLLNMEAARLEIDKTDAYRNRVRDYEDSLVFDSFLQKVIVPDSKMTEEEVKRHYDEHLSDYSSPEMVRIRSLGFTERRAAEAAMAKLRDGADYGWLLANAEGQVSKGAQGVLTFDGRPVTTDTMPDGLQKAVAGAKAGEFRLYEAPEGYFYVVAVQEVMAPTPRPYGDVRQEIAKRLHGEKLKKNLDVYVGKLRAASEIEIHLKKVQ
jgi:hypothetical protein